MIGQFLKLFSSETAGQMNRTLIGGIYGRSSIKIAHLAVSEKKIFRNQPTRNKN
jgi:hypothetical protein